MKLSTRIYIYRKIAIVLCLVFLLQICAPTVSYALTSGTSQPEVQSFEPITTTEMVDLFSGDFTYNIPLLEVPGPNGGYPINLLYNAGINMDQEASWVGLGWNLNPGAITRSLQGLPDEYNGSPTNNNVHTDYDIKPNTTISAGAGVSGIEIVGGDLVTASIGLDVRYNNYKGFGYTLRAGLSLSPEITAGNSGKMLGVADLGISLDDETGLGVNLSGGLKQGENNSNYTSMYVGVGYSQATGLSDVSFGVSAQSKRTLTSGKNIGKSRSGSTSLGTSLSMNMPGYLPTTTHQMETRFGTVSIKPGFGLEGVFASLSIHGTIASTYMSQIGKDYNAYGYMNAQTAGDGDMLDFIREQDGMIHKKTPNLPIPIATPDIFSMTSHGASTMFRAFRNDVGVYRDPNDFGNIDGGTGGLEIVPHIGGSVAYTYGENYTGKWTVNDEASPTYAFKASTGKENEAWYFKAYGEHTATPKNKFDNIGGTGPVRLQLQNKGDDHVDATLEDKNGTAVSSAPASNQYNSSGREKRNTAIQYINANDPNQGIYSITPEGSMYVYGKAELINKNVECVFAIDGNMKTIADTKISNFPISDIATPNYDVKNGISDKYYNKKTLNTPYAYSYLITEIRGADYIDVDNNNIVNDGDKGYWVKFTYNDVTTAGNAYKYRNPFTGANYLRGKNTGPQDDKAQYVYGEKTISYLTIIETNSHKAFFDLSARADGLGVNNETNMTGTTYPTIGNVYQQKLDYIRLYSKKDLNTPLLRVVFDYCYKLCGNVENNDKTSTKTATYLNKTTGLTVPNEGGKLTLKKVWIEYEKSKRGRMNAYQFDYDEGNTTTSNPYYAPNNFDRWGSYYNRTISSGTFTVSGTPCDIPYLPQAPAKRAMLDQYASAWSLRSITLPSGSKIAVTYEADDYGYVQNKRAMQMTQISHIGDNAGNAHIDPKDTNQRKIYFKLENAILTSRTDALAYFKKLYIGDLTQVYFRNYTDMVSDARMDYVGGYAPLSDAGLFDSDGNGDYDEGYILLGDVTIGVKMFPYHPFCLATWQSLMTDYPELTYTGKVHADPNSSKSVKIADTKHLFSLLGRLTTIFTGFYAYAQTKNWGTNLDLSRSYIRLQSPDYSKVGGGVRVKKIVLSDQWDKMQSGAASAVYGQYYDYTTTIDGQAMSSGVATYEPFIGGDENPFKTVAKYSNCIPLKLTQQLCFETNTNESYFPSPSVGYSKVTVKSLAAYNNEQPGKTGEVPHGIMSNGATMNEFYTCKDFPVIQGQTVIYVDTDKKWIPIPLIGSYLYMRLFATQGYSIELNDMHGRINKISTFEQATSGFIDYAKPVTYVKYDYFSTKNSSAAAGSDSYVLNNEVPVLIKNSSGAIVKSNQYKLGEHVEFFTDIREEHANETTSGISFNGDLITLAFVDFELPSVWPSMEHSENRTRIAVTNKIVHRFGVVQSITAYNNGSTIKTTNLVFDGQTGDPVLTSLTNNFNDPVYKYDVPASLIYEGMNSAATSIGIQFQLLAVGNNAKTGETKCYSGYGPSTALLINSPILFNILQPGDVFKYNDGTVQRYATITRIEGGFIYVQADHVFGAGAYSNCVLIKPGRKNLLNTHVGSVTTLGSSVGGYNLNPIDQLYPTE
jgi:hypothetical protein